MRDGAAPRTRGCTNAPLDLRSTRPVTFPGDIRDVIRLGVITLLDAGGRDGRSPTPHAVGPRPRNTIGHGSRNRPRRRVRASASLFRRRSWRNQAVDDARPDEDDQTGDPQDRGRHRRVTRRRERDVDDSVRERRQRGDLLRRGDVGEEVRSVRDGDRRARSPVISEGADRVPKGGRDRGERDERQERVGDAAVERPASRFSATRMSITREPITQRTVPSRRSVQGFRPLFPALVRRSLRTRLQARPVHRN